MEVVGFVGCSVVGWVGAAGLLVGGVALSFWMSVGKGVGLLEGVVMSGGFKVKLRFP